jgi:heme-degrading monooxygenase HmoA
VYGTIARMRVKPGKGEELKQYACAVDPPAGSLAVLLYKSDTDPDEYWVAVVFEGEEAFRANADSDRQNERYRQMRELLVADPEWHDGEVVHSFMRPES